MRILTSAVRGTRTPSAPCLFLHPATGLACQVGMQGHHPSNEPCPYLDQFWRPLSSWLVHALSQVQRRESLARDKGIQLLHTAHSPRPTT